MFSIKTAFRSAWDHFKKEPWKLLLIVLITFIPSAISSLLSSMAQDSDSFVVSIIIGVVIIAVVIYSIILRIGSTKLFLNYFDGTDLSIKGVFSAYGVFWYYIGTSILYALIVLGGLILLIVPGIIWAIKYSFSLFIVVDTKAGPMDALRESSAITKGSKWKLLGFFIILAIFNMLGYLVFGVGILVTIPISMLATIYVYRELSKRRAGIVVEATPVPPTNA